MKPSAQPTVTPHEKEILELKQDLELLKRELRGTRREQERTPIIAPDEAAELIRQLLTTGAPDDVIFSMLTKRGAPRRFVERHLERLRAKEVTPSIDLPNAG